MVPVKVASGAVLGVRQTFLQGGRGRKTQMGRTAMTMMAWILLQQWPPRPEMDGSYRSIFKIRAPRAPNTRCPTGRKHWSGLCLPLGVRCWMVLTQLTIRS